MASKSVINPLELDLGWRKYFGMSPGQNKSNRILIQQDPTPAGPTANSLIVATQGHCTALLWESACCEAQRIGITAVLGNEGIMTLIGVHFNCTVVGSQNEKNGKTSVWLELVSLYERERDFT